MPHAPASSCIAPELRRHRGLPVRRDATPCRSQNAAISGQVVLERRSSEREHRRLAGPPRVHPRPPTSASGTGSSTAGIPLVVGVERTRRRGACPEPFPSREAREMVRGSPPGSRRGARTPSGSRRRAGSRAAPSARARGRRWSRPRSPAARTPSRAARARASPARAAATGSGCAPSPSIRAATSTTSSRRQVGDRAVVAHVHDLDVAGAGRERGDELRGGLAVVRAAAALEELGLARRALGRGRAPGGPTRSP